MIPVCCYQNVSHRFCITGDQWASSGNWLDRKLVFFSNTVRWKKENCFQSDLFLFGVHNCECRHKRNGGENLGGEELLVNAHILLKPHFGWHHCHHPEHEMGVSWNGRSRQRWPKLPRAVRQEPNFRTGIKGKENTGKKRYFLKRLFKQSLTHFPVYWTCSILRVCFCSIPRSKTQEK